MPALPPYIPAKQADFNTWCNSFANLIQMSPSTYGLTGSDSTVISSAVTNWNTAFNLIGSAATKTPAAIAAKDTAKVTALAVLRPYAQQIANNAGVATTDKIAVGVNPRTSKPTPITPPTTYPILSVQAGANSQLYVRFRDSAASVSVKSKPYGCGSCNIMYQLSATPITNPTQLTNLVVATKSPTLIQFPYGSGGQQCYLAAYWQMKNGGKGGFGPIVSFTVPQGS